MEIEIFKFGGSSVKDATHIKNACQIISERKNGPLVVVVSAMGKTTNALERLLKSARNDHRRDQEEYEQLMRSHLDCWKALDLGEAAELEKIFTNLDKDLNRNELPYDEQYDLVIGHGEYLSTTIVHNHLRHLGIASSLADARELIITDDIHRNAKVDWVRSLPVIEGQLISALKKEEVVVIQGFLGRDKNGSATTLGREGSDYTGAILAHCLEAQAFTVWKDVDGIYSADPKTFAEAEKINHLDYREAIEMTYYGAKVIHPKTIKPLQNKGIPLHVRSYVDPSAPGTVISQRGQGIYPPIIVRESGQTMLRISTNDLSFVAEDHLAKIFGLFDRYRVKVNAMKNTAVSFVVCFKDDGHRSEACIRKLKEDFELQILRDLSLLTVRHYNEELLDRLTRHQVIYFTERYGSTIQVISN